jgi:hypothetical protein
MDTRHAEISRQINPKIDARAFVRDLPYEHGRFFRYRGEWLIAVRRIHRSGDFVTVISPWTGREGVCELGEVTDWFGMLPLYSFTVHLVREPLEPEDRQLAEARWRAHLERVAETSPVVTIRPKPEKRRRRRRPKPLAAM